MRIEQLLYLVEVSKNPSISSASEKLHISHQALNRSLKALEEELGTTLFNRSPNGVSLTPQGEKTVETAKNILNQLNDLKLSFFNGAKKTTCTLKGNLSIVSTPQAASTILIPVLCDFKKRYPKVNFFITETTPNKIISAIENNSYDFGIANFSVQSLRQIDPNKITYHPLYTEKSFALVPHDSPLAKHKSISIKTLLKHPLILYGSASDSIVMDVIHQFGSIENCSYTSNTQFFYESIANGGFSSIISASLYHHIDSSLVPHLVLLPLKENIQNHIVLAYRKNNAPSILADTIIDIIKTETPRLARI